MSGLILDTSMLIEAERQGKSIRDLLHLAHAKYGEANIAISTVTVVELTHGIYRARNVEESHRRRVFVQKTIDDLMVVPVTVEIAQLAGRIDG